MAEAFLRAFAGDEFEIVSAGGEAGRIDPEAVNAMREVGIDMSAASAKEVNPYLSKKFHYVITLCDREKERSCPIFPGAIWREKWPVESPSVIEREASLDHGLAVRRARDQMHGHIVAFVEKHHHSHSSKGKSAWN
jgi:arsenate reductase